MEIYSGILFEMKIMTKGKRVWLSSVESEKPDAINATIQLHRISIQN